MDKKLYKTIYIIVFVTNVIYLMYAVSIIYSKTENLTFDDAFRKAQIENKDILVLLTKEGCASCDKILNLISNNAELNIKLDEKYIYANHNVDIVGNEFLYRILKEYSFPLLCVFSPDGELITLIKDRRIFSINELIYKIDEYRDYSLIHRSESLTSLSIYKKTISNCLRAYLQNKNIIPGSSIESIDKSIEACPYFYNLYLKAKFI